MTKLPVVLLLFITILVQGQEPISENDSLLMRRNNFYKAAAFTSAYYAGSLFLLGETWYKGRERVPFHFYNDNGGFLQVDKFGHAFGSYVYSYMGYFLLRHAGLTRNEALVYGATLGFVLQAPIEIMDGIYENYGFSWGDMAANAAGSAFVIGQEVLLGKQLVKYKFSYSDPGYAAKVPGYYGSTFLSRVLKDYNGHTYWLSLPIVETGIFEGLPDWICISAGYGANGLLGEFENIKVWNGAIVPEVTRYRQYLLSIDVDWSRIDTRSDFLKVVFKGLTFIKLPFPALEFNNSDGVKGYLVYF